MLILTAFSQRDLIEQARDAGALAYLVKPFQKSDLIPAIEVAHRPLPRAAGADRRDRRASSEQLEARKVVDRAKGMLMDEHGLTESATPSPSSRSGDAASGATMRDVAERRHRRRRSRPTPSGRAVAGDQLLLLDGNSLTYRAFFALPTDLATARGQVTNAVFGFTSMLINVLQGPAARRRRWSPSTGPSRRSATRPIADLQGQPRRGARHPAPADGPGARGARGARHPDARAGRLRGRRHHRHARRRRPRRAATTSSSSPATATATSSSRTRTSRCSTTGAACQRLRALRRGRHRRAHRRHARRSTREYAALRGDPSDNLPGVPGRGREDGGQADHHLRRPRRDLRQRRRADAEAAASPRRARGPGPRRTSR